MNILQIVNQAEDELGLPRSETIGASTKVQSRQMLGLLNAICEELLDAHDWSALQSEATFNSVAGQDSYALASDFRRMIDDTQYDRVNNWRIVGPISPRHYTALRESGLAISTFKKFRLYGTSTIRLFPAPASDGEPVFYEYISGAYGRSNLGVTKVRLDADTDSTVFRDQLLISGIKWKYMQAKGFSAEPFMAEFGAHRSRAIADDIGGRDISFATNPIDPGLDGSIVVVLPGA